MGDIKLDELPDRPEVKALGDSYPLAFTHFSRKKFVYRTDGEVHGSWQGSFAAACVGSFDNWIPEGAVTKIEDVGTCSGGTDIVVMCQHY